MTSLQKVGLIAFIAFIFSIVMVYMDIKGMRPDIAGMALILFISIYSGFGLVAGWELLSKWLKLEIPLLLQPLYFIIKWYLAVYIGLIYLPFWLFKKYRNTN